jgi:hypothetical protein
MLPHKLTQSFMDNLLLVKNAYDSLQCRCVGFAVSYYSVLLPLALRKLQNNSKFFCGLNFVTNDISYFISILFRLGMFGVKNIELISTVLKRFWTNETAVFHRFICVCIAAVKRKLRSTSFSVALRWFNRLENIAKRFKCKSKLKINLGHRIDLMNTLILRLTPVLPATLKQN